MAFTTCRKCKEKFKKDFEFCPNCGAKKTNELLRIAVMMTIILLIGAGIANFYVTLQSYVPLSQLTNERILSLPPTQQTKVIASIVGKGCQGTSIFYMGQAEGTNNDNALWSIKCANGKSYIVEIKAGGGTGFLECSVLDTVHGTPCFQKLPAEKRTQGK
jgi:hypothetical protein